MMREIPDCTKCGQYEQAPGLRGLCWECGTTPTVSVAILPSQDGAGDGVHVLHENDFLIPASSIHMENATFAWDPYVALKAVNLLVGIGGLGKSHFTIDIAARLTRGQLEGDLKGHPVNVVIATAEDALSNTMVPRLSAAGADLDRVSFVNVESGFAIPDDVGKLEEAIEAKGDVRVVIIDPIVAFVPIKIDTHKDQHARTSLAPLASLAERRDLAIIAIMHLNKAVEAKQLFLRISGSSGFYNAARSALLVAEDPEDERARIVAHGKHNLSEPGESRRFRIEGVEVQREDGHLVRTSRVVWLGATDHTIEQLLDSDHRRQPRIGAERWLLALLVNGPVSQGEIQGAAEAEGHAWATVRRAKEDLGVESKRHGGFGSDGEWFWHLPEAKDAARKEVSTLDDSEPVSAGSAKDAHFLPDQRAPSSCVRCERYGQAHIGGHISGWKNGRKQ
jgi:putative DNA primase/helicase